MDSVQQHTQMPLRFEQRTTTMDLLIARLFMQDRRFCLESKPPSFYVTEGASHPSSDHLMLDAHIPNARRIMQSLVSSVFKKSQWFQFPHLQFIVNIVNALVLFEHKILHGVNRLDTQ